MGPMTTSSTTTALPLAPGRWNVDPAHSSVGFSVRHLGVSKVRGRFPSFDADVVVGEDLAGTSVTATIDLESVDTGNADRDAHLQQADMFDVANRPTLTFRSTGVVPDGDGWRLDGELTLGDVSQPVSLAVELGGVEVHPADGRRHAGFEAVGEVRRIDLGVATGIPAAMLGNAIKVELDLQLIEPEQP
jgi:polyisoprenoid-binding protein YceI